MRKAWLSALAMSCAATPLMAADLGQPVYKAPPVAVAPATWNGFYVGINGGIAAGKNRENYLNPGPTTLDWFSGGGFAGGQIGYNWQFAPNWVLGVEADYQAAAIRSGEFVPGNPPNYFSHEITSFGTARGRLGYAFGDTLVYGTGGYAWGRSKVAVSSAGIVETARHSGWSAGAGVEYALAPGWSGKIEYLYVDLGREPRSYYDAANVTGLTLDHRFHAVRAGLNYRFGGGGALMQAAGPGANWSGLYIGVNGGYAATEFTTTQLSPFSAGYKEVKDGGGGLVGGQVGYNWQFAPSWLLGVEADYQASRIKAGFVNVVTGGETSVTLASFGTARGRLGFVWDRNLIYGTAGYAWGSGKLTVNSTFLPTVSASHTGWTAGAGVERQFAPNWSAKAEYLYVDLGTRRYAVLSGYDVSSKSHVFRAGLNYRFGSAPF